MIIILLKHDDLYTIRTISLTDAGRQKKVGCETFFTLTSWKNIEFRKNIKAFHDYSVLLKNFNGVIKKYTIKIRSLTICSL